MENPTQSESINPKNPPPQAKDGEERSIDLPRHLRDVTSLRGGDWTDYMNETGWPAGGKFSDLLSSAGYSFYQTPDGRNVCDKWGARFARALAVLILEQ